MSVMATKSRDTETDNVTDTSQQQDKDEEDAVYANVSSAMHQVLDQAFLYLSIH